MNEEITTRDFWISYWDSKKDLIQEVPSSILFADIFEKLLSSYRIESAIELGGFPGQYSIFLKKYYKKEVTLFDFVIHKRLLEELLQRNQLNKEDIRLIEGDVLTFQPAVQYDFVFSLGLIEHFTDTEKIISRHLDFLKPGGILLITLPNFKALNGWLQKTFDPVNYSKHHIPSMDIDFLESICKRLPLTNVKVSYYKSFSVWLENEKEKPLLQRTAVKLLKVTGLAFFKIFPVKSRSFSPYIVITAEKANI